MNPAQAVETSVIHNSLPEDDSHPEGRNNQTEVFSAVVHAEALLFILNFRYADRAKKIKNKAVVNENPMDKLIRELREENEKLKKSLGGGGMIMEGSAGMTEEGWYNCTERTLLSATPWPGDRAGGGAGG